MKNTKRSLLVSALSLLLCVSMLVGSTFAWFTDSVTSRNNVITSGNLDVELEYSTDGTNWAEVKENTALFSEEDLWEPGHVVAVALRVKNAGSLALKYDLSTNIFNEKTGTNVYGEEFKLSDYLKLDAIVMDGSPIGEALLTHYLSSRNASGLYENEFNKVISNNGTSDAVLLPAEEGLCVLRVTMPSTVGNEANHKTGTEAPVIKFGIDLVATQVPSEYDSFDNQYDKDATYPEIEHYDHVVDSVADLLKAAKEGGSIILTDDITFTEKSEFYYNNYAILVRKPTTLNLNGHSIVMDVHGHTKTADAPVMFYIYDAGASLTVVGDGDIYSKHDAFIFFPRSVSDGLNIYGGNYYNIDETSGTKNDINAIVYSQLNNKINIYGGTFTFKNVNGHCGGFNVYDNSGAEIVLHEGVLLSNSNYYKGSDADEIHLADGCSLEEVVIDGTTWYKVVKN